MGRLLPLIALALVLSAGAGIALLLMPRGRRVTVTEMFSLSLLFGTTFVSLSSFWLGWFWSNPVLLWAVTLGGILLAALGLWNTRRRAIAVRLAWPSDPRALVALFILVAQAVTVLWIAIRSPLG